MARYSLFVFLILFLSATSVLSRNDQYLYTPDSENGRGHQIDFRLLDDDDTHSVQRREATEEKIPPPLLNVTQTDANATEASTQFPKKVPKLKSIQPAEVKTGNSSVNSSSMDEAKSERNNTNLPISNSSIYTMKAKNLTNADMVGSNWATSTEFDNDDYEDPDTTEKYDELAHKHNITLVETDTHVYYNSTLINDPKVGQHYWVDLTNRTDVKVNSLLSRSHRRAATVKLSFEFPFYGHLIQNVTIATGGFLYTGGYVHSWLAATQYIAPLMANFDTNYSNDSLIKYVDNGTAFTVEWHKVRIHEKPSGEFTFQVTLHKTGDIIFVYKHIPVFVHKILDVSHPVRVGLSDAYILNRHIFYVRRKTIYEYDRVDFKKEDIRNWTTIYLKLLPNCLDSADCGSCLTRNITFKCMWCPSMNKCSTGIDRHRQDWIAKDCDNKAIDNETMCSSINATDDESLIDRNYNELDANYESTALPRVLASTINNPERVGISGIIAILFLLTMIVGVVVWIFYAYKHPHTTSGQILIRYRPSQWRWRRGEARYTAATIHM